MTTLQYPFQNPKTLEITLGTDDCWSPLGQDSPSATAEPNRREDLLVKTRFLQIEPGKSFARTIELTKPFRSFGVDAWGGSRETRHPSHFKGYEAMQRFRLDPKIKKIRVRLEYNVSNYSRLAFQAMFGFDLDAVHLWRLGRYDSNEVVIVFE